MTLGVDGVEGGWKRIDLAAVAEWDDLELLSAEAGRAVGKGDIESYRLINSRFPELEAVAVTTGRNHFSVTPAPGEVRNQLTFGLIYHRMKSLGWQVSNVGKHFDPMLAAHVSKHYGARRLRYRSTWLKVTIPEELIVEGEQQQHKESVGYMIEALSQHAAVIKAHTFWELSARSLARAMPRGEAEQYLEAMGVR
jgi:hypothetical protein